ncbi:MAG: hypothetical protein EXR54_10180 [Dehalococcoidia bacterium]|nr:hypothetical protein [Dehalococcoidia bacterium]MSQ17897.1 hypothetical protein [Dehalococcoidia bacterium]
MDKTMIPFDWYAKAKARIDRFLPGLDKDLEVDVDTDIITPHDGGAEYSTFMLTFWHPTNPKLNWSMEVRLDEEYIQHQLEETVRKIYYERVE